MLEPAIDEAVAALCAEAVGVMRRLLADTVEYAKQRKQFDAPIAANQVLQHRMVDMYMALEQAVSMTYMATLKLDRPALERMRGRVGRQGADRQGGALRRPGRDPDPRRHGHDQRTRRQSLLQAGHDDRVATRLRRLPPRANRAV